MFSKLQVRVSPFSCFFFSRPDSSSVVLTPIVVWAGGRGGFTFQNKLLVHSNSGVMTSVLTGKQLSLCLQPPTPISPTRLQCKRVTRLTSIYVDVYSLVVFAGMSKLNYQLSVTLLLLSLTPQDGDKQVRKHEQRWTGWHCNVLAAIKLTWISHAAAQIL